MGTCPGVLGLRGVLCDLVYYMVSYPTAPAIGNPVCSGPSPLYLNSMQKNVFVTGSWSDILKGAGKSPFNLQKLESRGTKQSSGAAKRQKKKKKEKEEKEVVTIKNALLISSVFKSLGTKTRRTSQTLAWKHRYVWSCRTSLSECSALSCVVCWQYRIFNQTYYWIIGMLSTGVMRWFGTI